jgi:hypothetical protein
MLQDLMESPCLARMPQQLLFEVLLDVLVPSLVAAGRCSMSLQYSLAQPLW